VSLRKSYLDVRRPRVPPGSSAVCRRPLCRLLTQASPHQVPRPGIGAFPLPPEDTAQLPPYPPVFLVVLPLLHFPKQFLDLRAASSVLKAGGVPGIRNGVVRGLLLSPANDLLLEIPDLFKKITIEKGSRRITRGIHRRVQPSIAISRPNFLAPARSSSFGWPLRRIKRNCPPQ
jgi:hypothetical protein